MAEDESVKVAVRVRPFNKRERARNATCIIQMSGQSTTITNPEEDGDERTFNFDHSYWSHDGAKELDDGYFAPEDGANYIGQKELFNDLGVGVLKNAWDGYNTSLFAYGQTGSGKSWSVVGYGANKGIVPMFCETIFNQVQEKQASGEAAEYQVLFSMLEIYNERVRDLLNPQSGRKSLKVRQHPKKGFYAEGLLIEPVKDYNDIEMRMEEGTKNRTVASTNMNATSSRAHTIVGVTFTQKMKNAAGQETAKTSVVNLVDLAGSERADSTGATGNRLKEGAAINQSLSSLGNCIAALAEKSQGKKVRVPFRNSVLTMLLKNALGGNSKTIMVAALSPADINYEETLSTLRYADRAKQIKCKATVNEDPTEKLIRELQEENQRLKDMLEGKGTIERKPKSEEEEDDDDDDDEDDNEGMTEEEVKAKIEEELAAQMAENERMVNDMKRKWEEKLAEAEAKNKEKDNQERSALEARKSSPHIYNLNPDPMLTGMIVHLLKQGMNKIGRGKVDPEPDIPLLGLNILLEHGEIMLDGESCKIKSCGEARLLVNGEPVTGEVQLQHHDRIAIGTNQMYAFVNPLEAAKLKEQGVSIEDVTYEMAQEELAKNSGLNVRRDSKIDSAEAIQKDELLDFIPDVHEANAMSEEMDKKMKFEPIFLSPQVLGKLHGKTEIYVKADQLTTGYQWLWSKQKFLNRKYLMNEMYEDYQEGNPWNPPEERDPFMESCETECLIGVAQVYLQCIAYLVDLRSKLDIIDYRSAKVGELEVEILPCDENGNVLQQNVFFIDSPNQLEGKRIDFKIAIRKAKGLPKRFKSIFAKYSVLTYENMTTNTIDDSVNINFRYSQQITVDKCSDKILEFLTGYPINIQLWGQQKPGRNKPINNAAKLGQNTKAIMAVERMKKGNGGKVTKKPLASWETAKRISENFIMEKRLEAMRRKLMSVKELCDERESEGQDTVLIVDVRNILGYIDSSESVNPQSHKKRVTLIEPKHAPRRSSSASSFSSISSISSSDDEKNPKPKRRHKKKSKKKDDVPSTQVITAGQTQVVNGSVQVAQEIQGETKVIVVKTNKQKSSFCTLL